MDDADAFRSALDWADAIRRKEVSPVEVLDLYLARIDRLDPQLNAFCHRADDEARAAARAAADAVVGTPADELGPFHGVPLPIKDLNDVAGWPTTHGSEGSSPEPVAADDHVVARLRAAGFVFSGKTTTPELGTIACTESRRLGASRNPWDTSRTPGGSSGGAGAAVASGMAPLAQASDGGGSIRIPASCNGLVGLKASRNRITNGPNDLEGFSTAGVVSRTVADTAAALDVLGVPDPLAWYNAPPPAEPFAVAARREPGRLRIGATATPPIDLPVDPEVVAAHAAALELLAGLGHDIVDAGLPDIDADRFIDAFTAIWNTGSAGMPLDMERLEPLNRELRSLAIALDSITYVEKVHATQLLSREIVAPFGRDYDVLVTPTMACLPLEVGAVWAGADEAPIMALLNCYPMGVFTSIWNVTGLPAISLPLGTSAAGVPIGVQLVGGPWQEATLLQLAAQVEAAAPWADRRPAVS